MASELPGASQSGEQWLLNFPLLPNPVSNGFWTSGCFPIPWAIASELFCASQAHEQWLLNFPVLPDPVSNGFWTSRCYMYRCKTTVSSQDVSGVNSTVVENVTRDVTPPPPKKIPDNEIFWWCSSIQNVTEKAEKMFSGVLNPDICSWIFNFISNFRSRPKGKNKYFLFHFPRHRELIFISDLYSHELGC